MKSVNIFILLLALGSFAVPLAYPDDMPWMGSTPTANTNTNRNNQAGGQIQMPPALQKKLDARLQQLSGNDDGNNYDSLQTVQNDLTQSNTGTSAGNPFVTSGDPNGGLANKVQAKATGVQTATAMSDVAFGAMVNKALPLTPDQILKLHTLFDATQTAIGTQPGVPPKPVSHTLIVDLSPGATPPIIRLSTGFISTLVFVDSSGAPWPIEAYDLGNPKAYNISWDQKSNMMMIQAISQATVANLMVKLRELNTPVMLTLTPNQLAVDYRVDMHIPGYGPQSAGPPIAEALPDSANPVLLDILNGIAPIGSKVLTVSGADCQAWLFGKKLYLRTRFKMISPGWLATMASADGTNAYELQRTPFILLTGHGKTIPIKVSGF